MLYVTVDVGRTSTGRVARASMVQACACASVSFSYPKKFSDGLLERYTLTADIYVLQMLAPSHRVQAEGIEGRSIPSGAGVHLLERHCCP